MLNEPKAQNPFKSNNTRNANETREKCIEPKRQEICTNLSGKQKIGTRPRISKNRTDEKAEENSWEERVKRENERNEWCTGETGKVGFFL